METASDQQATTNTQERIRVGMVGHSLLNRYPLNQFPYFINIILQIHVARIVTFFGEKRYREIVAHRPKLDAVIFILGGNDIDDHDHTDEHLRDISFSFLKTAKLINSKGIRTFFLPIHPR